MRDQCFYLEFAIGLAERFDAFVKMFDVLKLEKDNVINLIHLETWSFNKG